MTLVVQEARREFRRNGMIFRIPEQLLLPWSPKKSVSVPYVAEKLGCSSDTIYRLIEAGDIKGYKLRPDKASSPWRINYDSFVEYVRKIHREAGLEPQFE